MIGASKILTVSYGTFSCTLEGFDDPFNTMRAIAEYFRDLAAEDRYFGAEPPQPDAAMLHRIAEREIHRKVEARVDESGVTLRADSAAKAAPLAAPQTLAAQAVAAPVTQAAAMAASVTPPSVVSESLPEAAPEAALQTEQAAPDFNDNQGFAQDFAMDADFSLPLAEAEPSPVASFEPAPEAVAPPALRPVVKAEMPEGVASKLARLRQAVAETASPAVADTLVETVAEAAVDHAHAPVAAPLVLEAPALDEALLKISSVEVLAETPLEMRALADEHFEDEHAALAPASFPTPPADFFAAQNGEAAALVDFPADDLAPEFAPDLSDLGAAAPEDGADEVLNRLDALLATPADAPELEAPAAQAVPPQAYADVSPAAAAEEGLDLDSLIAALSADPADVVSAPYVEWRDAEVPTQVDVASEEVIEAEEIEDWAAPVAQVSLPDDLATAPEVFEAAPSIAAPAAEKLQRARARVIKIRRADLAPMAAEAPVEPEADVARLMKQTDEEMAEPENQRRLASIQHLKAAVAATVAERRAGVPQADEGEREQAYRADLARVVRPVRPRQGGEGEAASAIAPTQVPASNARPAPLVLVSSQRIDAPLGTMSPNLSPVRPRRPAVTLGNAALASVNLGAEDFAPDLQPAPHMAAEDEDDFDTSLARALADEGASLSEAQAFGGETRNIFTDALDFSSFADRLGAVGLAQLMEAAAAFATIVEKRDSFTRPQLMRRALGASEDHAVNREDGLRSFGMLLREGRIEKVARGQYALPEGSPIAAEARRIAG